MSNCRTGCPDQNHESYAECLRSMTVRIAYANSAAGWDYSKEKRFQKTNAAYRQAVKDGLQPRNISMGAVNQAYDRAEKG